MSPISSYPMAKTSVDSRLHALLEEYGHVLRRAIHRVVPRHMTLDVDDIEQEARLKVWRAMQRETVFEKPASYLYRVAVNASLDAVSQQTARREQSLELGLTAARSGDAPSPERRAVGRQLVDRVRQAMEQLQPNRRRAVGLHLQGFTTTEIGEFYGWSEAKARNLAYRGLGDLRRLLAGEREALEQLENI